MSLLERAVAACLVRQSPASGDLPPESVYSFPPGFAGFRGHFPGNPVLPGVCIVQAALLMVQRWRGQPAVLRELSHAKFYAPVGPDEELGFRATDASFADGECRLSVTARTVKKVAELNLRIAFDTPRRTDSCVAHETDSTSLVSPMLPPNSPTP
jgi:hypothetical protein